MANPNAHLKYLFLLNSEDPARAQPRFQTFVRDIGGKAQDVGLEDRLQIAKPSGLSKNKVPRQQRRLS